MALKKAGFNLEGAEAYMDGHQRLFISFTAGLLVFVGIIALSVFFIATRGKEEVMVPDVSGKELTAALIELQEKELYPRIQMRSTEGGEERGIILEQSPEAGTLVRAERRIELVISSGFALDKIGDYLGKNINDVRSEVMVRNAQAPERGISLMEPFMYQYSAETAGTVLQQNPAPGSDLTGAVTLELVVSRGQENARVTVPNLTGLSLAEALDRLGQFRGGFTFTMREAAAGETAGTVYSQNPAGGAEMDANGRVTVTITAPAAAGETAGLFRHTLPANPYPLPVTAEALFPGGDRRTLISVNHGGGEFTLPYSLPAGSVIILSMLGREIHRQNVNLSMESLSADRL